jgi:hypothetical protein
VIKSEAEARYLRIRCNQNAQKREGAQSSQRRRELETKEKYNDDGKENSGLYVLREVVSREAYDINVVKAPKRTCHHRSGEYCSWTLRVPLMLLRGDEFRT